MKTRRQEKLNSLLKEVLSDVIRKSVRNPDVSTLTSVIEVDISKDLHHAKAYVSVIGTEAEKKKTLAALQSAAGFIAVLASKMVVMHHFPQLTFKLDTSADKLMRIDEILIEIEKNKA